MTDRRFFVGGNFKMNGDKSSLDVIISNLNQINSPATGRVFDILLCHYYHCYE